jgi:hypothetical protein
MKTNNQIKFDLNSSLSIFEKLKPMYSNPIPKKIQPHKILISRVSPYELYTAIDARNKLKIPLPNRDAKNPKYF